MSTFQITIDETGETFPCHAESSVLEGMFKLGRREIPLGCRGGACGVCRIEVLAGDFRKKAMSRAHVDAADEKAGRVLACRIFPMSDLKLKVSGPIKRSLLAPAKDSCTHFFAAQQRGD
ncbi:MAG: 2Fe-2S iron-sulfur cluster binding domain-containing protein [Azonexus sp.]|nr:2Fe-2S iron-sulfur cluster binding domain-containing protein [Azonexus sp.]